VLETFFNQSGTDTSYTVYAQIYTAYAWKSNPIHDGIVRFSGQVDWLVQKQQRSAGINLCPKG
jgi:hypothetical protein